MWNAVLCVGAVVLPSSGIAYEFNDMVTGAPSCAVWRGMLSSVLVQHSCLAAAPPIFFNDMVTGALSCTVWCGMLSYVLAQKSCLVSAPL